MTSTTTAEKVTDNRSVTVAPLVLLSVVDHYNRIAKNTSKRVVGVLLGESNPNNSNIRVLNSYAVPFEEDEKNSDVWFLDHNYIESMRDMFKKVNAKEKLIGWYHSGPKLRASDAQINELFKSYTPDPLLLIVDVQPAADSVGIPTDAYLAIEEIKDEGKPSKTFVHVPSLIEAEEAEEIGVEHLLRDIRDAARGNLATRITNQLTSLQGLHNHLAEIVAYLQKVLDGSLPPNHVILGKLQDVFNLLPNLSTPQGEDFAENTDSLGRALTVKTNDELMVVYLSSLVRAIIAFHNLIENKIENKGRLGNLGSNATGATTAETATSETKTATDEAKPNESK